MNHDLDSERDQKYQVGINPEAMFSVFYQDERGRMIFSIEVDDEPRRAYLNPRPTEHGRVMSVDDAAAKARVRLAIDRVKAYFVGQGLSVELD
jgi:hypothetical protein